LSVTKLPLIQSRRQPASASSSMAVANPSRSSRRRLFHPKRLSTSSQVA
jgi:hypothetical protein